MLQHPLSAYDVQQINPEIFRACDIRGMVDSTLTPEVAYFIGRSFGTLAHKKGQHRVVIGRDGRHSGVALVGSADGRFNGEWYGGDQFRSSSHTGGVLCNPCFRNRHRDYDYG